MRRTGPRFLWLKAGGRWRGKKTRLLRQNDMRLFSIKKKKHQMKFLFLLEGAKGRNNLLASKSDSHEIWSKGEGEGCQGYP